MSTATVIQEKVTPWKERLATVEAELSAAQKRETELCEAAFPLADAVASTKAAWESANPLKRNTERVRYFQAVARLEDAEAELRAQSAKVEESRERLAAIRGEGKKIEAEISLREKQYNAAKSELEQAENSLRNARAAGRVQSVADLETLVASKRAEFEKKDAALKSAWELRGDPVSKQSAEAPKVRLTSPTMRLRAQSAEFRDLDNQVGELERKHDLCRDRKNEIEREVEAITQEVNRWQPQGGVDEHGRPVDRSDPMLNIRAKNLAAKLAEAKAEFEKVCADRKNKTEQPIGCSTLSLRRKRQEQISADTFGGWRTDKMQHGTAVREGIETPAWANLRQQIERLESQRDFTLRRIDQITEELKSLAADDDRAQWLTAELGERKKRFVEVWRELTSLYARRIALAKG